MYSCTANVSNEITSDVRLFTQILKYWKSCISLRLLNEIT